MIPTPPVDLSEVPLPLSWPQYPAHWTLSRDAMCLLVHRHVERTLRGLSREPIPEAVQP
jgi:hypothetical protein